jgi:hypothetical protein
MRWRVSTVFLLVLALVGCLGTGCGRATVPETPLMHTRVELVQARSQVRFYAAALTAAVGRSRLSRAPAAFGTYRSCPSGKGQISYHDVITVTADVPATMSELSREIAAILRSQGWQLVSVDFAKVHLGLADTNHPLYDMRQHGISGAANILPYGSDSAGALIFMNSPCINAGSLAAQVVRGGHV